MDAPHLAEFGAVPKPLGAPPKPSTSCASGSRSSSLGNGSIDDYIAQHNEHPTPFIWTATASDILEKVKRGSHFGRLARFPLRCCYYFGKCKCSFNSCAILSISIMSISAAGGAGRPCGCPSASRRICSTIRELSWLTPKDTSRERTVSAEINSGGTRSPLAKALRRAVAEPEDAAIPLDGDGLSKEAGKLV